MVVFDFGDIFGCVGCDDLFVVIVVFWVDVDDLVGGFDDI